MRAIQMTDFRKPFEITDIPDPQCGERDVVIKVEACGVCRTEWHLWNGDWAWIGFQAELPHTPGHEVAGKVVEVGSGIKKVKVGDNITVPWHWSCGDCHSCNRGITNTCENVGFAGFGGYTGAYAEYFRVPNGDTNVIALPDSIGPLDASVMSCRYMAAFGAVVRKAQIKAGEWLVVMGAGGQGLASVQIGAACGANVIAIDIDDAKLGKATELGAVATVNVATDADVGTAVRDIVGGQGAHATVDTVARPASILNSCLTTRRQGKVIQTGYTTQPDNGMLAIPMELISLYELQIIGSGIGMNHSDFPELISLVERGLLRPRDIVTEQIGLDGLTGVVEAMDEWSNVGFQVVTTI
ncbi:MAG: alcohol dehydrogenase catalytic domain-containing protein [Sporichthyaceae bacterium]